MTTNPNYKVTERASNWLAGETAEGRPFILSIFGDEWTLNLGAVGQSITALAVGVSEFQWTGVVSSIQPTSELLNRYLAAVVIV